MAVPVCLLLIGAMLAVWRMRVPRTPDIVRAPRAPGVITTPTLPEQAAMARSPLPEAKKTNAVHSFAHQQSPAKLKALPRLAVFPTPRPLTPEEQALVTFAQHGPPAVQRAVLNDQQHWDDPIIVAGLSRQPLPADTQQDR